MPMHRLGLLDRVKLGIVQCTLQTSNEEYETQCINCPYFYPDSSVEECKGILRDDVLKIIKMLKDEGRKHDPD